MRRLAAALAGLCVITAACSSAASANRPNDPPHRNPLAGKTFYVDPGNPAGAAAAILRQSGQLSAAQALNPIADTPQAIWLNGTPNDANTIAADTVAAKNAGRVPMFIMYNAPGRNCGGFSGGGAANAQIYTTWFHDDAAAISGPSVFIIEPDLIPEIVNGCLKNQPSQASADLRILKDEVQTLRYKGAWVYLDAGNSSWVRSPAALVPALRQAGIASATGISLNVANFQNTATEVAYGQRLATLLGGKGVIIDTSRNGNGPPAPGQVCNPSNLALGHVPTTRTGDRYIDAFAWIKQPGTSDGNCNGYPPAGAWIQPYALGLIKGHSP